MNELNERVAALELALAAARAEIANMQRLSRRTNLARTLGLIVVAATVAVVASTWGLGVTHAQESGQVVNAPFIVRDSGGKTILRVDEGDGLNQLALLNPEGVGVAALAADKNGGLLIAAGPDGKTRASIGLSEFGDGGLALWDADRKPIADIIRGPGGGRGLGIYDDEGINKVEVATQPANHAAVIRVKSADQPRAAMLFVDNNNSGLWVKDPATGTPIGLLGLESPDPAVDGTLVPARVGLTIYSSDGAPVVQAFRNPAGNGTIMALDKSDEKQGAALGVAQEGPTLIMRAAGGAQRAGLWVSHGKPTLEMRNSSDMKIVSLFEASKGSARFELGDSEANVKVEAGTVGDGRGMVRVYPWEGVSARMLFGLPGTYIVGHEHGGGQ